MSSISKVGSSLHIPLQQDGSARSWQVKTDLSGRISHLLDPIGKRILSDNESKRLCRTIQTAPHLLEAIREIVNRNCQLNPFIASALLNLQQKRDGEGLYRFKWELFSRLPEKLHTISNVNSMMHAAGNNRDFETAHSLFTKEVQSGRADAYTYSCYLSFAGKMGLFNLVEAAFNMAPESLKKHVSIQNAYIAASHRCQQTTQTKTIFQHAIDSGIADEATLASYLSIAMERGDPMEFQKIFDLAGGMRNEHVYSTYLIGCEKFGLFREAAEAFAMAEREGKLNSYVCTAYLRIAALQNQGGAVKSLFEKAWSLRIADLPFCTQCMEKLGYLKDFEGSKHIYDRVEASLETDELFYSTYIRSGGRAARFDEAKRVFLHTINLGIRSELIDSSYLFAANQTGNVAEIFELRALLSSCGQAESDPELLKMKQAFTLAHWFKTESTAPYFNYFTVMRKRRRFDECTQVFVAAAASGRIDTIMCNQYLQMQGKLKNLYEMKRAFWKTHESGLANQLTYTIYADALQAMGQAEEGRKILESFTSPAPRREQDGLLMLDLHGYSYGAGFLELLRLIESPDCPKLFGVIVGKGLEEYGNHLTFRNDLDEKVRRELSGWISTPDPDNDGVLLLEALQ